jgi:histone H3/H4
MVIIVRSRIKDFTGDLNVSSDFGEVLEKKTTQLIKEACDRAKANQRRTVMGKDL